MAVINNKDQTLQNALRDGLSEVSHIDILTGFFYFSGFSALADELEKKKMRILVGLELDPNCIPEIATRSKSEDVDLSQYQVRGNDGGAMGTVSNFQDALVGLMNDTDVFENRDVSKAFEIFRSKILDGTLEIRKTHEPHHGKLYNLHDGEHSTPGINDVSFMGSSNFSYNGLIGQGELNAEFRAREQLQGYSNEFKVQWEDSRVIRIADAATGKQFMREIDERIWKYSRPTPEVMYLRVLHEIFGSQDAMSVRLPGEITGGAYWDLQYQIDAIKGGLLRLRSHGGAILADVTGLGKSIIASAIARNLNIRTIIICPPHLMSQWKERYIKDFNLQNVHLYSLGVMDKVYADALANAEPTLFIVDEVQRFRNENNVDYALLHKSCRSHPDNKVLGLSATPFNNAPQDLFAIVKLFQSPGSPTIRSVDNFGPRFRKLIERYGKLRRELRNLESATVKTETLAIAEEQRALVEPIIIRRSRLDLESVSRYKTDLVRQGISFPEVIGPQTLDYDLGDLALLYHETLEALIGGQRDMYQGARYKPTSYLINREKFMADFGTFFNHQDLILGQQNNAENIRRLLITRFESSKAAFQISLERMLEANKMFLIMAKESGVVSIQKRGNYSSLDDEVDGDDGVLRELEQIQASPPEKKNGIVAVPLSYFSLDLVAHVELDLKILEDIHKRWFGLSSIAALDPKIDRLQSLIEELLREDGQRKIVVFSSFADTVNYVSDNLKLRGFTKTMAYTAKHASKSSRKTIEQNFDASIEESEQRDDFEILVATDALSEGFNLHRAGVVINYDIPYNPTRVVQRVGRINRIDQRRFDELYIFNFFPTAKGEEEVGVKRISTLKMNLINAIVGADHKTLTSDESVETFFKDEFDSVVGSSEHPGWERLAREDYDRALGNSELMEAVSALPRRSRIRRSRSNRALVALFGKKGESGIFGLVEPSGAFRISTTEELVEIFRATPDEEGFEMSEAFDANFEFARSKLFGVQHAPQMKGRRREAVLQLQALANSLPQAENFCKDLIEIIRDFDDVDEGTLVEIANLPLENLEETFRLLQLLMPKQVIMSSKQRVSKRVNLEESLLLVEEFS